MWLPSDTTTYSWGVKCDIPSCEMMYCTWHYKSKYKNSNHDWRLISDVQFLVHTESNLIYQVTRTSVTWLSPDIRCWTVCPSMVVICWIYALSSWYRHACMDRVTIQHLQKETLEHIGYPLPDLWVLEPQWCVPVRGSAASLGWSLSGVPAGLWCTQSRSWRVLWLFRAVLHLASFYLLRVIKLQQ